MKKTQIIIAVVAVLALGAGGFAAYRHFSGKRAQEPQTTEFVSGNTSSVTTAVTEAVSVTKAAVTTAAPETTAPQPDETTAAAQTGAVTREGLEAFLSELTRGYFAADAPYSAEDPDLGEVLRFSFMHVRANEPDAVSQTEVDGMTYFSIGADAVQTAAQRFFGLTLPEADSGAFLWRDGAFMMPAAGGLPRGGSAVVRSFDEADGRVEVSFIIGDDMQGSGNAVLTGSDGRYTVVEYYADPVE